MVHLLHFEYHEPSMSQYNVHSERCRQLQAGRRAWLTPQCYRSRRGGCIYAWVFGCSFHCTCRYCLGSRPTVLKSSARTLAHGLTVFISWYHTTLVDFSNYSLFLSLSRSVSLFSSFLPPPSPSPSHSLPLPFLAWRFAFRALRLKKLRMSLEVCTSGLRKPHLICGLLSDWGNFETA